MGILDAKIAVRQLAGRFAAQLVSCPVEALLNPRLGAVGEALLLAPAMNLGKSRQFLSPERWPSCQDCSVGCSFRRASLS